jgi:hypothetical protein
MLPGKYPYFIELLAEKSGLGGFQLGDRSEGGLGSSSSFVSADA